MKARLTRPVFDRDEYFESSSRMIRWVCLGLVLITFPFETGSGLIVLTIIIFTSIYNLMRYSRRLMRLPVFNSRVNSLTINHIFVLSLVILSGGLSSPYYPL